MMSGKALFSAKALGGGGGYTPSAPHCYICKSCKGLSGRGIFGLQKSFIAVRDGKERRVCRNCYNFIFESGGFGGAIVEWTGSYPKNGRPRRYDSVIRAADGEMRRYTVVKDDGSTGGGWLVKVREITNEGRWYKLMPRDYGAKACYEDGTDGLNGFVKFSAAMAAVERHLRRDKKMVAPLEFIPLDAEGNPEDTAAAKAEVEHRRIADENTQKWIDAYYTPEVVADAVRRAKAMFPPREETK